MVANIYSIYHLYILYVANLGSFLYATSHLLGEPETTIELSYKKSRESEVGNRKSIRNQLVSYSYLKENQGFYNLIERLVPKNHGSNFPQIQSSFQWMIKGPGKRKVFRFPLTFFRGWARIPRDWKKNATGGIKRCFVLVEMMIEWTWNGNRPCVVSVISHVCWRNFSLCFTHDNFATHTQRNEPIAAGDFSLKQWHGFEVGMAWSSHARPTDLGLP